MIYFENNEQKLNLDLKTLDYHSGLKDFLKKVNPLINRFYDSKMNLFKEKMNWKNANGKGFKAHQDQPAWTDFAPKEYVTMAIFANNTTVENGCLEFATTKNNNKITDICQYEAKTTGELKKEIVNDLIWNTIETTTRDILIFDSYVPHRSGDNNTKNSRRVFYFTFNDSSYGNLYDAYLVKKREEFPPEIERINKNITTTNNKYNLANPIN